MITVTVRIVASPGPLASRFTYLTFTEYNNIMLFDIKRKRPMINGVPIKPVLIRKI